MNQPHFEISVSLCPDSDAAAWYDPPYFWVIFGWCDGPTWFAGNRIPGTENGGRYNNGCGWAKTPEAGFQAAMELVNKRQKRDQD